MTIHQFLPEIRARVITALSGLRCKYWCIWRHSLMGFFLIKINLELLKSSCHLNIILIHLDLIHEMIILYGDIYRVTHKCHSWQYEIYYLHSFYNFILSLLIIIWLGKLYGTVNSLKWAAHGFLDIIQNVNKDETLFLSV